jgi:hypothetical protein
MERLIVTSEPTSTESAPASDALKAWSDWIQSLPLNYVIEGCQHFDAVQAEINAIITSRNEIAARHDDMDIAIDLAVGDLSPQELAILAKEPIPTEDYAQLPKLLAVATALTDQSGDYLLWELTDLGNEIRWRVRNNLAQP